MLTLKKKNSENALRFKTDVVLNILCLADFTCVDRPTVKKAWCEFHFNKYKLMGFSVVEYFFFLILFKFVWFLHLK